MKWPKRDKWQRWPWGALVSALTGYWLADTGGALVGLLLGYGIDASRLKKGWLQRLPLPDWWQQLRGLPSKDERLYRDALFITLGHLAKQDGRVSPQEIAAAESIFKQLRLKAEERQHAINQFNHGKATDTKVEPLLEKMGQRYHSRLKQRLAMIEMLLNMVYADGGAKPAQLSRLQTLRPLMQVSMVDFDRLHRRVRSLKGLKNPPPGNGHNQQQRSKTSSSYGPGPGAQRQRRQQQSQQQSHSSHAQGSLLQSYHILGLNSHANTDEIKRAYRKLMSQYHPDKLASQSLTPSALDNAKQKVLMIQEAYSTIRKARGF